MSKVRLTAEERRHRIIDKAAEVFARHGVVGTRTRDIAQACGINEALLYRYFESKDELYRKAMIHAFDEATKAWIESAKKQPNGLLAVVEVLRSQLTMLVENPVLCANMWHGVAATIHDPHMRELVRERFDHLHDFKKLMIAKGIEDGSIRPDVDPDLGAGDLRAYSWGFILRKLVDLDVSEKACEPETYCNMLISRLSANIDDSNHPE